MPVATEAGFTQTLREAARAHGWLFYHARPAVSRAGRWCTPTQGDVGFPDVIAVHPKRGKIFAAELKLPGRKPTLDQERWLAGFLLAGVPAFLWTPNEWPDIETVLRG